MTAKRQRRSFQQESAEVRYSVPKEGDRYLVDPATDRWETVHRVVREGTGPNARTFTVTNSARNLAWIRFARSHWVDAILHVDCGGFYGEPCLYAHVGTPNRTTADAQMLAPEALAAFVAAYPEEAA